MNEDLSWACFKRLLKMEIQERFCEVYQIIVKTLQDSSNANDTAKYKKKKSGNINYFGM